MRTLSFLILFFGGIAIMIISINGIIGYFFNIPSLFGHLIMMASVIVATSSFKTFIMGINGAFSKKYLMTKEQCEKTIALFKMLQKTVNYTSLLMVVIGLMVVLGNLTDLSSIGPSLSLSLIAIVYGVIINLAFIQPAIYILSHKHESEPAHIARIKDKEALDKLMQLCFEKGLTHEDIMDANEITLRKSSENRS